MADKFLLGMLICYKCHHLMFNYRMMDNSIQVDIVQKIKLLMQLHYNRNLIHNYHKPSTQHPL